ncbi:MAG TPA: hypothetical protein VF517_10485 [Thermoleophilaceae bacterium]|jgi:hypothetical protein
MTRFEHCYSAREAQELDTADVYDVPAEKAPTSRQKLIEIDPQNGPRWLARCSGDYAGGLTGLYSCPNEHDLCVVIEGAAYILHTATPGAADDVEEYPTVHVLPCRADNLLILGSFDTLTAYGPTGFVWQTESFAHDGFAIHEVRGHELVGVAESPAFGAREFRVDLRNGAHEGGTYWVSNGPRRRSRVWKRIRR